MTFLGGAMAMLSFWVYVGGAIEPICECSFINCSPALTCLQKRQSLIGCITKILISTVLRNGFFALIRPVGFEPVLSGLSPNRQ